MKSARYEVEFWLLIGVVLVGELLALAFFFYMKRLKVTAPGGNAAADHAPDDRRAAVEEVERLRAGFELDESLVARMSVEVRALFEVTLIDALARLPRKDQHRLRSMLIKHGYDEYCARRIMKGTVPDSVRAATILHLLRPQSQASGQRPRMTTGELKLPPGAASEAGAGGEPESEA